MSTQCKFRINGETINTRFGIDSKSQKPLNSTYISKEYTSNTAGCFLLTGENTDKAKPKDLGNVYGRLIVTFMSFNIENVQTI